MEYARSKGLDQYERKLSLLGFKSAKSHTIDFLKTMGCLNKTKCFMMMIASFMDLHGIHKPVSTLSHNSHKLLVSTRYTTEKSHSLHDIKADIFNSHIIIQDGFSGL